MSEKRMMGPWESIKCPGNNMNDSVPRGTNKEFLTKRSCVVVAEYSKEKG
jgi:hypothetical protein